MGSITPLLRSRVMQHLGLDQPLCVFHWTLGRPALASNVYYLRQTTMTQTYISLLSLLTA